MKTKMTKEEKRKHARTPVGIALDVHLSGQAAGKASGRIVDLSDGGMAFQTEAVMEKGMSFFLGGKLPVRIRGEVRSIRDLDLGQHRYGIRFHKIGRN